MNGFILFFGVTVFSFNSVFAAVPVTKATTEKTGQYVAAGVIVGGQHQADLSLLSVRKSFDKKNSTERIVLDIVASDGKTPVLRPGFFHLAIQQQPARIVIDLENTTRSIVSASDLAKVFSNSHFFQRPALITSSNDKTVTLELALKVPVKLDVFELSATDKPARIVVDAIGDGRNQKVRTK